MCNTNNVSAKRIAFCHTKNEKEHENILEETIFASSLHLHKPIIIYTFMEREYSSMHMWKLESFQLQPINPIQWTDWKIWSDQIVCDAKNK